MKGTTEMFLKAETDVNADEYGKNSLEFFQLSWKTPAALRQRWDIMAQISIDAFYCESVIFVVDIVNMLSRIHCVQITAISGTFSMPLSFLFSYFLFYHNIFILDTPAARTRLPADGGSPDRELLQETEQPPAMSRSLFRSHALRHGVRPSAFFYTFPGNKKSGTRKYAALPIKSREIIQRSSS